MKLEVFDVILYLFENYIYEDEAFDPDQLEIELQDAGFQARTIDKAFAWIESLDEMLNREGDSPPWPRASVSPTAIRHYSSDELDRLDTECRGFILFLEQMGVLDSVNRELVIDRVMALESEEIDLDQLKWVVLMILFNQPGSEAAAAWMEDIVIDQMATYVH